VPGGEFPEKFEFSVRDDEIARQILAKHRQAHGAGLCATPGVPSSCFGDTEYFVEKVQVAQ